jgi:hypothetical protein
MPEDPHLPEAVHNQDVMIVGAVYAGGPDDGEKVFQSAFDPFFPKGQLGSYWKSIYLSDLSDEALDLVTAQGLDRPNDLTLVHVPTMGGAASPVDPADTAFGDRSAPYMLSVDGNWGDSASRRRLSAGCARWSARLKASKRRPVPISTSPVGAWRRLLRVAG